MTSPAYFIFFPSIVQKLYILDKDIIPIIIAIPSDLIRIDDIVIVSHCQLLIRHFINLFLWYTSSFLHQDNSSTSCEARKFFLKIRPNLFAWLDQERYHFPTVHTQDVKIDCLLPFPTILLINKFLHLFYYIHIFQCIIVLLHIIYQYSPIFL